MDRQYTYAELCRMKKKRVIRLAGMKNMKHMMRELKLKTQLTYQGERLTKKYIARIIASDR